MGASAKETVSSRFVGPESKLITGENMLKAREELSLLNNSLTHTLMTSDLLG